MDNNNNNYNYNYGGGLIIGLLGILFVYLKLTGAITWSWWIVLLPFYGPLILWFLFAIGVMIFIAWVIKRR